MDHMACPLTNTGSAEWTTEQAVAEGQCAFCARSTTLRIEPFSTNLACKSCWEAVCYGE